jgi:tungstate transport system ATP-binding protein
VTYALQGVTKVYGRRQVLAIEALDIAAGELLAVVGPSGAGKSTLLRLLNLLELPSSGALRFQEHTITAQMQPPLAARRQVTTVFQSPAVLAASVFDNVAYGLRLRLRRVDRRQIDAALERVGLAHLARQPARTLSAGERQRLALARALVIEPAALLLDEPTANLDPANVRRIEQVLREAHQQRGTTIVLVTHALPQARRLAQRTALLLDGSLVEVADTARFFHAPRDARTAAFISGEMVV